MKEINKKELRELFIEIKHDNKIAFEKFYKRYNKLVYSIAFSILKNKDDSEDLVQIVFAKIYSLDKSKLPNTNELSWIYTLTKNETINYLKRKKNNIDLDLIYEIEDTNSEINKTIDRDAYNSLISKLNNKEKEIISLKVLSNLSFSEIAKTLNMPTGTVKWKYYKSIHTLKLLLSNLGMFVVSFISSIIVFENRTKKSADRVEHEFDIEDSESEEETKGESAASPLYDSENKEMEVEENIVVDVPVPNDDSNYLAIGLMGLSIFFFMITIIFFIIFIKYQLKGRKKLSK